MFFVHEPKNWKYFKTWPITAVSKCQFKKNEQILSYHKFATRNTIYFTMIKIELNIKIFKLKTFIIYKLHDCQTSCLYVGGKTCWKVQICCCQNNWCSFWKFQNLVQFLYQDGPSNRIFFTEVEKRCNFQSKDYSHFALQLLESEQWFCFTL